MHNQKSSQKGDIFFKKVDVSECSAAMDEPPTRALKPSAVMIDTEAVSKKSKDRRQQKERGKPAQ